MLEISDSGILGPDVMHGLKNRMIHAIYPFVDRINIKRCPKAEKIDKRALFEDIK